MSLKLLITFYLLWFYVSEIVRKVYGCKGTEIRKTVLLEWDKRRKSGRMRENAGLRGDIRMQNVGFERGHSAANWLILHGFCTNSTCFLAFPGADLGVRWRPSGALRLWVGPGPRVSPWAILMSSLRDALALGGT